MKKKSSIAAVLLMSVLFLIFIAAMPKRVSAESPKGSIKISLKDLGTSRQNVALSLYKVGTWNGTGWELEACFNDTGISADTLQYASDWEAAAKTLSAHTALTSVERKAGQTDENGIWTMEELAWGMYLLVQEGESTYGTVSPALIAVPYVENGVQNSERIVYPKAVPPQEEDGGEENTPPNPDSGKEDTSTEPDNEDHNTSETIGGGGASEEENPSQTDQNKNPVTSETKKTDQTTETNSSESAQQDGETAAGDTTAEDTVTEETAAGDVTEQGASKEQEEVSAQEEQNSETQTAESEETQDTEEQGAGSGKTVAAVATVAVSAAIGVPVAAAVAVHAGVIQAGAVQAGAAQSGVLTKLLKLFKHKR